MPRYFALFFTVFIAIQSFAQNFKRDFARVFAEKDTTKTLALLQNWQKAHPEDAELFVAYFNYYFINSRKEIMQLGNQSGTTPALEIKDSTGLHTMGFLSTTWGYDSHLLNKGFQCINAGILKHPTRLDMRFGKIYALLQIEDYEAFTSEIITTIEAANQVKNQWTWADDKKVEEPKQFLLKAIQDYVVQLYNAGDDQLNRMRRIAQAVLKYYPNHVESLSNLAITYGLQGNYDAALEALLKAEKIAPGDVIVLNNIATMYERKGDKQKAIKYYERTKKYGDKEIKTTAIQKLKELNGMADSRKQVK